MMVLQEGMRVKLKADPEEGWPEELGEVVEVEGNDVVLVRVDEKFRLDEHDDLLREVTTDQLEEIP